MVGKLFEVYWSWNKIKNSNNEEEVLVKECLLHKSSFRLPKNSNKDVLIGIRVLYRTIKTLISATPDFLRESDGLNNIAIIDNSFKFVELEFNYIRNQSDETPQYFINKSKVITQCSGLLQKLVVSGVVWCWSFPIIIKAFWSKSRSNLALTIVEMLECAALLTICKKKDIGIIYDFIPYEKDGNFLSYLAKKNGIRIVKLPSPGPLKTHNSVLFGDELVLSSAYQFEELKHLKNIKIKTFKKWLPEYAFEYIYKYIDEVKELDSKKLGFYSHGGWLRHHLNWNVGRGNAMKSEESILKAISLFLSKNKSYSLIIYLHPMEKDKKYRKLTMDYYSKFFGKLNWSLKVSNEKTTFCFDEIDIAISSFSSIIYERLFCGFKLIIGNYYSNDFPLRDSPLNNICFNNYERFENLISRLSNINNETFFSENKLMDYRYDNYPYFKEKHDYHY